jgi:excisionase family DNA binding protein
MSHASNPGNSDKSIEELLHKEQYNPDEAAYLLGMDVNVIHQAAHRHDLPATFVGHDVTFIRRADLLRWLETR